ncbi:MAG: adenylate/guanylate cyclase domain-containing protein, partial [Acidimicrobiia bacterium]
GSEGTATLVFTDIVDSTVLAQSVGDVAWAKLIGAHERTIGRIAGSHGGTVVKFLGDGSMLVFESARAAIRAAVELQRSCDAEPYAIRIGIHTGEVIRTANDLLGLTVNKAARVASAATGGSIMVSSTTRELVGQMEGVRIGEPKIVRLKGIADAHQIAPVEWQ